MFKTTDRQRTFFEVGGRLEESVSRRLKGSWAEGFQAKVLPLLLDVESDFKSLYSDETGRPNYFRRNPQRLQWSVCAAEMARATANALMI